MLKKTLKGIRDYIALLTQGRVFYQRYFTLVSEQNYKQDNREVWNKLSKAYARKYDDVVNNQYLNIVMKNFDNKHLNILEFGCSSGMNLNYLYLQYPSNHYYGVDISDVAIALGRKNYPNITLENNLNTNKSYDIIFTRAVLQHIDNDTLTKIINNFTSILNRGGVLMINEAYFTDKPFGRIDNHRIYNTFNHDYFKLLNQFNIEYDKDENIFKCYIKK